MYYKSVVLICIVVGVRSTAVIFQPLEELRPAWWREQSYWQPMLYMQSPLQIYTMWGVRKSLCPMDKFKIRLS